MELETNTIPSGPICEGCLSADRKITPIYEEDYKKFFNEILEPLDFIYHPLSLCWECTALIRRVLRFKKQVKAAHDCLVSYMLHQTTHLTTLSRLTKSRTEHTGQTDDDRTYTCKTESNRDTSCVVHTTNNVELGVRTPETNLMRNEGHTQPMAFIKIEGQDDLDFGADVEGFYVDEQLQERELEQEVDDKDLKAILKSGIPANGETKKSKIKKRRRATALEFDESDDEPLRPRRDNGNEVEPFKPKGRRKKKVEDGPKIDRRKHPAPKREKPPGVVNNPRVSKKLQQLNVGSGQLEMVVLSWEEVEAERQKALNSVVFTRHEYRCYDCVLGFNHKFKLENHMKKHDPAAGPVWCGVCRVRCRDAHALCAHRRRHRVRWRCVWCGETSSRAAVAADHFAREHNAPPPTHTCTTCGHRETTLGKLRNHIKNHAERQKCELCQKTFRDRTSLKTHLFIHKGEKEYACPRCEKRFLFKKAMEVHLVTHDAPAQLYCYECDMNFKNRMSYYQHMRYNLKHIDPAKLKYACQLCDKKFVKATRLEEHHIAVHLKATPIQCTMPGCNFACSSRPVLRTHVRMVHRNLRAVRNHVCDTCGKAYTTKKTLEGHMRSHTGERPFKCKHCPSTFGYEAALYNHNKLVHLKAKSGRSRAAAPPPAPTAAAPGPSWELALNSITHTQQHSADIS